MRSSAVSPTCAVRWRMTRNLRGVIETIPKRGYRLLEKVELIKRPPRALRYSAFIGPAILVGVPAGIYWLGHPSFQPSSPPSS